MGNGLTIGLTEHAEGDVKQKYHPSWPLSWELPKFSAEAMLRHDAMRTVAAAFDAARESLDTPDDFAVMIAAVERARMANASNPKVGAQFREVTEMTRRYLASAYTHLTDHLHQYIDSEWLWTQWMIKYRNCLRLAVSFNYDLVLESLFLDARIPCSRIGLTNEGGGVPIFKPHGSVDFGPAYMPFSGPGPFYLINNDGPQRRLNEAEMSKWREEANLVLPGESSWLRNNQTVQPGFSMFASLAPTLTHCVFLGISYWGVDRPEIDEFVAALPRTCEIVDANPYPSDDLRNMVASRGLTIRRWTAGPEDI